MGVNEPGPNAEESQARHFSCNNGRVAFWPGLFTHLAFGYSWFYVAAGYWKAGKTEGWCRNEKIDRFLHNRELLGLVPAQPNNVE